MPSYSHTQTGWWWIPTLLIVGLAFGVAFAAAASDDQDTLGPSIVVLSGAFIVAVVLVFSRLIVEIEDRRLTAAFGLGWPRRVVDLSEVTGAQIVTSPWWYGFGIRKIPGGWMWNIRGPYSVEMHLPDDKVVRIGTDEPDALLAALSGLVPNA